MFEHGLLVSLPAQEIPRESFAASILSPDDLNLQFVSPELRAAVELITDIGAYHKIPLHYVVRPEMFTEGVSLYWLRNRIGEAKDHLALSDGSTMKVVPSMRNHAFFYGLARCSDSDALRRLAHRVPELFAAFETQINTAFSVRNQSKVYCPETLIFSSGNAADDTHYQLLRFFLSPFSPEASLRRILATGSVHEPTRPFRTVLYVPLTETGLRDSGFARSLAIALTRTMFDETSAVVLALPSETVHDQTIENRLRCLLEALNFADAPIPGVFANNLFIATGRLSAESLRRFGDWTSFLAHESFDFWRSSPSSYSGFRSICVLADSQRHSPTGLTAAVTAMCGRDVEITWTDPSPDRSLI